MKAVGALFIGLSFNILFGAQAWGASAEQLLARDLGAAKKTFQQEKRLYHYFDIYQEETSQVQNMLRTPEGRKQIVWDRISFATKKFWKTTPVDTNGLHAGEGLYLAVDPSISESYGKMMVEFRVKSSTYYIDLYRGIQLQNDTIQAIYKQGFLTADPDYGIPESFRVSEMTLNMILRPGNEKFRQLFQRALQLQNITLVEYFWRSDLEAICGENSNQTAFVYIGTNPQMPEFTFVEMADVKRVYPQLQLTAREYEATVTSMKLIQLIHQNFDLNLAQDRIQNAVNIFRSERAAEQMLQSLHGCLQ